MSTAVVEHNQPVTEAFLLPEEIEQDQQVNLRPFSDSLDGLEELAESIRTHGQIENAVSDWNKDRDNLLARVPGSGMGLVRKIKKDLPTMALKWGGAKAPAPADGELDILAPEPDDDLLDIPEEMRRT